MYRLCSADHESRVKRVFGRAPNKIANRSCHRHLFRCESDSRSSHVRSWPLLFSRVDYNLADPVSALNCLFTAFETLKTEEPSGPFWWGRIPADPRALWLVHADVRARTHQFEA